ncbi:hypothetical protein TWF481_011268 [Arthrobotrys musiformis]|uniref:Uncharacterized protein n=1 Tax=Arthrobotrys musiformis TaxID=47236 RepID=A0AAV9VXS2_9PEZI
MLRTARWIIQVGGEGLSPEQDNIEHRPATTPETKRSRLSNPETGNRDWNRGGDGPRGPSPKRSLANQTGQTKFWNSNFSGQKTRDFNIDTLDHPTWIRIFAPSELKPGSGTSIIFLHCIGGSTVNDTD